jgi:hypothetical protein
LLRSGLDFNLLYPTLLNLRILRIITFIDKV